MSRPVPEHGTRARYYAGCHCPDCTAVNTRYQRGYRLGLRGAELDAFTHGDGPARSARTASGRTVTWIQRALPV